MINTETLQGNWHEIKGMLRSKWGQLTDDDVAFFDGNVESLMGTIQRKTGEARDTIEHYFEQLSSSTGDSVSWVGETMRAGAHQASDAMRAGAHHASDAMRTGAQHASDAVQHTSQQAAASMRQGYDEVESVVRQRPIESLAVCFGVGVITGLVAAMLLRSR